MQEIRRFKPATVSRRLGGSQSLPGSTGPDPGGSSRVSAGLRAPHRCVMMFPVTDEVLADQVDYYRRRAGEYDVTAYGDVAAARARIARLVAEMRLEVRDPPGRQRLGMRRGASREVARLALVPAISTALTARAPGNSTTPDWWANRALVSREPAGHSVEPVQNPKS